MPADLGEPSMKVPERPAGIVGTARPRALAMATKGVGRTRAKDCCAQIAIVRAATLAVRDRPKPASRLAPKQPDGEPSLFMFRFYEAAVRNLTHSARSRHHAS